MNEAVEGPIGVNFCRYAPPRCDQIGWPLRLVCADIQNLIREKLGGMILSGCLCSARRTRKKRNTAGRKR